MKTLRHNIGLVSSGRQRCTYSDHVIRAGEHYDEWAGLVNGSFVTEITCRSCKEAAENEETIWLDDDVVFAETSDALRRKEQVSE